MQCLECGQTVPSLDNMHLLQCSGLTLHEYALRHGLSLDVIVAPALVNRQESDAAYPRREQVTRDAEIVFAALQAAGKVRYDDVFCYVTGEVRQLDQLLWLNEHLLSFGFRFRQEYVFSRTTHRVVACNHLKTRRSNVAATAHVVVADWNADEWLLFSAILLAVSSAFYGGYVFFTLESPVLAERLQQLFERRFHVRFRSLPGAGAQHMLRTESRDDATALLDILRPHSNAIPGVAARYFLSQPSAKVAKTDDLRCRTLYHRPPRQVRQPARWSLRFDCQGP